MPATSTLTAWSNDLDLDIWTANFGMGTAWQLGDVNYDGVVNGLDFDLLSQNVGKAPLAGNVDAAGGNAVPEPGTLALLAAALIGLLVCAQRRRLAA